jgi:hypothetical protein
VEIMVELNKVSELYKEYTIHSDDVDDSKAINLVKLENELLRNILYYGQYLDTANEKFFYLDMGINSFEEFLTRNPLHPEISNLAYAIFLMVKDIKSRKKTEVHPDPNQCPECNAKLLFQGGHGYCFICGFSKAE